MSQISRALKKLQEQRQKCETPSDNVVSTTYIETKEVAKPAVENVERRIPFNSPIDFLSSPLVPIVGMAIALLMSVIALVGMMRSANEIHRLKNSNQTQEQSVSHLTELVNNTGANSIGQINNLKSQQDKVNNDLMIKVNNIGVKADDRFVKLKESILDDRQQLTSLTREIQKLQRKMDEVSMVNNQVKASTAP